MEKDYLIKNTKRNHRLLIHYLKEYHIEYDFLDELFIQHGVLNLIDYFNDYMKNNDVYSTLSYGCYSILFSYIKDNYRSNIFRILLNDMSNKFKMLPIQ